MNRRLQQFLELEQLKPAQFADIMGIQRSNVSHILSGRNKPGFDSTRTGSSSVAASPCGSRTLPLLLPGSRTPPLTCYLRPSGWT